MAKVDLLKKIWQNRTIRNYIILATLIIVFLIVLIINLQPPEPRKSERVLMCRECNYTNLFKFSDIKKLECPKCKAKGMKYCMKCKGCEYEFPYIETPLTKKQKKTITTIRAQRIMDQRCTNWRDKEVFPLSSFTWRKKHPK